MDKNDGIRIALISLHGLIRGEELELGRDEDTGGQTRYVLELARALSENEDVSHVDLITRQIIDERVSEEYARLEEPIAEKASIVRIPFGPKRYLGKSKLWPYIEVFVDQCLSHFQRTRTTPDVIHGHYADAGYGGGQLSRLIGVPFVFTGHSLGRVKKERLEKSGVDPEVIEKRYSLTTRIEAEEFALETCSLICTSTHQEVKEQYEQYEHYVPERMEVIPPGVDLDKFRPSKVGDAASDLVADVESFLSDPAKPLIVAMARPDERKNLEMLVRTYGESAKLQEVANLVLIMGSRDDLREMPPNQRQIITNILTLIDVYNLYGKVAYPKKHKADDVPTLYRAIAKSRGVFVNAAMTEPFGLTLLEAAASGAPIVATNDGGPIDIIANCRNGVLVDPFDQSAIEQGILKALLDTEQWNDWSANGLKKVDLHYSWERHVERYLRDVQHLLSDVDAPKPLSKNKQTRRLRDTDRLIIADIDNTLTGDDGAMRAFFDRLDASDAKVGFGIATGRHISAVRELIEEYRIPQPEVMISSVGTEIYYGEKQTLDTSWARHIYFRWEPDTIRQLLENVDGLFFQKASEQSLYKISYEVDFTKAPPLAAIRKLLRENGIRAKCILSLGMYLDIIPSRAGSGLSIRHIAYKWGFPLENLLIAGNSGNDAGMLAGNTLGVVVGNYSRELERLRRYPRVYFAEAAHASGILEGMDYYDFLGNITVPNEQMTATEDE